MEVLGSEIYPYGYIDFYEEILASWEWLIPNLYDKQIPEVQKWMLENLHLWWGKKTFTNIIIFIYLYVNHLAYYESK